MAQSESAHPACVLARRPEKRVGNWERGPQHGLSEILNHRPFSFSPLHLFAGYTRGAASLSRSLMWPKFMAICPTGVPPASVRATYGRPTPL